MGKQIREAQGERGLFGCVGGWVEAGPGPGGMEMAVEDQVRGNICSSALTSPRHYPKVLTACSLTDKVGITALLGWELMKIGVDRPAAHTFSQGTHTVRLLES